MHSKQFKPRDVAKPRGLRMKLPASLLLLLLMASPLWAQAADSEMPVGARGASQGVERNALSSEEQGLLAPFAERWQGLPPGRQQSLRKGIKRWTQMTPEQQARAKKRFSRWKQLPPEKRQRVRRRFEQFMSLPAAERQRVRQGFRQFRDMPPERREALRERWRQMSAGERRAVLERRQLNRQIRQHQRQEMRREIRHQRH